MNKTDDTEELYRPSPYNFDEYVCWACKQMQVDAEVVTVRVQPKIDVVSGRSKSKSRNIPVAPKEKPSTHCTTSTSLATIAGNDVVKIISTYDYKGHLIQIKFDNNRRIVRNVLKMIELILQFHTLLTKVTINRGINNAILSDLNDWLPISNITDICLDNAALIDGNYEILLENDRLRQISLARCNIDDGIIKNISSKLIYPLPASNALTILNLASNKITDTGANYLAEVLRCNRQLAYLNISDNLLGDEGAGIILNSLVEFALNKTELLSFRYNLNSWLEKKIKSVPEEMESKNLDEQFSEQRSFTSDKATHFSINNIDISDMSELKKKKKQQRSCINLKNTAYVKENSTVETEPRVVEDAFSPKNILFRNNHGLVCLGNNYLALLNLSYNDLSYISLKNILSVLIYQKNLDRTPRGLIKICLEGNYIPSNCAELQNINQILNNDDLKK